MRKTLQPIFAILVLVDVALAQDTNFAYRLTCEVQTPGPLALGDLTWQQGTTPLIAAEPRRNGRPIPIDTNMEVRMLISQSATNTTWAQVTNDATIGTGAYYLQWPTIGTNSVDTVSTNGTVDPWYYVLYFEKDGQRYWTGSGALYIEETTSTAADGLVWQEIIAGAAEDATARAGVASNAASIAAVGAVASGAVQQTDATYTAAVEQAGTAYGWGDHGAAGYALSSALLGYLPSAQAATQYLSVTSAAATYLPLAGHNGPVVLGTRTRGYAASTNLGDYGFAVGAGSSAGQAGFAAGNNTSAGEYGFAAGSGTSAGEYGFAAGAITLAGQAGFAAGESTTAGDYGFAAGEFTSSGYAGFAAGDGTSAGDYGFAAGHAAKGADGSFVFADISAFGTPFNRTNFPNSFSLRVAGGIYAEIGTNVFAVSNAVTMNGVELGAGGGSGISASTATGIAQTVLATYTDALPLPGCAILPVDPATSNAWITGTHEYYAITSNLTPVNLCISNTVRRIGYQITMLSTQAVTLATNMVRIGSAWTPTGTNLVVIWPHCDAALWRVKGQAQ